MKCALQRMLITAVIGLIGLTTYAQYRTEHYFIEHFDGATFKPSTDSFVYYFSGINNWTTALDGLDLSEHFANLNLQSISGEYNVPKYPLEYSKNPFSSLDSTYAYAPNTSGDGYGSLSVRYICTRDINGDVIEYLSQAYSGGTWSNISRINYSYSSHKIIEEISQQWIGGEWTNSYKEVTVYDSLGNVMEYTGMNWTSGTWVGDFKYLYEYDANANCLKVTLQDYSGGTFVNLERTLNTYNTSNKMIESELANWTAGTWIGLSKHTITYNAAGLLDMVLEQKLTGGSWEDYYRYTYFYTGVQKSGFLAEKFTGGIWEKKYKTSYTYTSVGKIKELLRSKWVPAIADWKNQEKLIFNFDANNNISNFYNEIWNSADFWELTTSSNKYYFVHGAFSSTAIQDLDKLGQVQIFPNPTAQNLNVKISWNTPQAAVMNVYDINGRILLTQDLKSAKSIEKTIDVSSFSNGTYFLQISNNNGKINQSFQVVK